MKHEIIYTKNYALIVSDEKVEEGSFIYETNIGQVSKVDKWYCEILEKGVKVEPFVKVIAHRPLTNVPILEGVPLLPEFEKVEDVEDLALSYSSSKGNVNPEAYSDEQVGLLHGFIDGYNKAKKTYNLTLTKLIDLYIEETGYGMDMWSKEENQTMSTIAKIIQSLQQPKRPKYFECEYKPITPHKYTVDDHLEVELKTITNSQGQTKLVGEYSYG